MIVAVVAVASVSVIEARVCEILRAHLIASVRRYHECLHEEIVVEFGQAGLTVPRIDDKSLGLELLFRWEHIVSNL